MAGTAFISSTFTISVRPTDNVATVITNPGRAFRIVGIAMNNTSGGAVDVDVTTSTGALVAAGTWGVANTYCFAQLTVANAEVAAGQDITVTTAAFGSSDQIDLWCVATGGGQPLTAT